jgi:ABC-2 type transport system permease protein
MAGAGIDATLRHVGTGLRRGDPLGRTVMKRFLTLLAREVSHYFHQPLAYIVLFFFLLLTAANFHAGLVALNRGPGQTSVVEAVFNTVLFWFPFVLIFPLLTMRLFSEEYKLGTIETLMTAPVRDGQVVVAKFLGSFIFYLVLWAPSLLYFVLFRWLTGQSAADAFGSYLGAYSMLVLSFYRLSGVRADKKSDRGRNRCFRADKPDVFP